MRDNTMQGHSAARPVPPLVETIREFIDYRGIDSGTLHVSVAQDMKWEKSQAGDEVLVRWLCWSVNDANKEIVPPQFEVVGAQVTLETLAKELPDFFPGLEVIVDNDIEA